MDTIKHNIGIAFNLDGSAICHSIWNDEKLIITDFWTGKDASGYSPVSLVKILECLDNIIEKFDSEQKHQIFFYCSNRLVRLSLENWAKGIPHKSRVLELLAPPANSAVWMISQLHDGSLAAVEDIDIDVIHSAFLAIGEDEEGKATGSSIALALLYGVGEPVYRRVSNQEKIIFSSVQEVLS